MSGHSHAKTVKRKKDAADAQRGKVFSKITNEIMVAAREGGDPNSNPRLRTIIDKAKAAHMPTENIQRAIRKGTGEESAEQLEEFLFEAYGPGGTALLIHGITDNKNRSLGEVKQILTQHQAKMVGEGAARWMFERKGSEWVATQPLEISPGDKEKLERLVEALDDNDAIQETFINI